MFGRGVRHVQAGHMVWHGLMELIRIDVASLPLDRWKRYTDSEALDSGARRTLVAPPVGRSHSSQRRDDREGVVMYGS